MNVLGIDTATAASAACVVRDDGEAFEEAPAAARLGAPPGHSRELLAAAAACVEEAGLDWPELDAIAVGVGPGAFTGLRVGVATARALASAHGAELRPVSSLAALAAGAAGEGGDAEVAAANGAVAAARAVLAAIDARRGELFAALEREGEAVWEPFLASPEAVAERVRESGLAPLAVGDGAVRWRAALEGAGAEVPGDGSGLHVVRGLSICRLGMEAAPAAVGAVAPEYVREPDAAPRAR